MNGSISLFNAILICTLVSLVIATSINPNPVYASNDQKQDDCPFDTIRWDKQDGPWNPAKVISEIWDPYNWRDDGDDGSADLCLHSSCDKSEIPGLAGHALSTDPLQKNHLPMSSGDDDIPGGEMEVTHRLRIDDLALLPAKVKLNFCIRSTAYLGNSPNSGGYLKSPHSPEKPRRDVCFNDEKMLEDGWTVVDDDSLAEGRPQHLWKIVELGAGETDIISHNGYLEFYDSRATCEVAMFVEFLDQDHDNDEGSQIGEDDEGTGTFLGGVGQRLPVNSESYKLDHNNEPLGDGLGDAVPDVVEIIGHGKLPDYDNQTLKDSPFRIEFCDDQGNLFHPDPLASQTVPGTRDDQQDSERGFLEVVDPAFPPQFAQVSKGDGLKLVVEQAGVVVRDSPVHPDSRSQIPLRPWQMAEYLTFENTAMAPHHLLGRAKKVFIRVENKELLDLVLPSLEDSSVKQTFTENLGVIPILINSNHFYPAKNNRYYDDIMDVVSQFISKNPSRQLYWKSRLQLGASINFNNGGDSYRHLYLVDSEGQGLLLDPKQMTTLNAYAVPGLSMEVSASTPAIKPRPPQLADFVITHQGSELAALNLSIEYNKPHFEYGKSVYKEHINTDPDMGWEDKYKAFASNVSYHECTHELAHFKYHSYTKCTHNGVLDAITDIHHRSNFDHVARGEYYQLKADSIDDFLDNLIGFWSLVEFTKDTATKDWVDGELIMSDSDGLPFSGIILMRGLYLQPEKDGQTSPYRDENLMRHEGFLVPKVFVDQETGLLPQGRYWLFNLNSFHPDDYDMSQKNDLYASTHHAQLDLNTAGYLTESISLLSPEWSSQDMAWYKQVNLQRLDGPLGTVELSID